jgi:outer membrane protein assembly factor BamD
VKKHLLTLLFGIFLLASCSGKQSQEGAIVKAETLFSEGKQLLNAGQYKEAAEKFEQLQREHPAHPIVAEGHVQRAYALHSDGQYETAIDVIDAFIQQHPAHDITPYMFYLKALCYYDQILDVGRDQDLSIKAQEAFIDLKERFPGTKYARDASLKLEYIHNLLAGKEMDIARFYLQKGEIIAALNRFHNVVSKYETTIFIEEALYRLTEIYYTLGDLEQAKVNAVMLGYNYPQSIWYHKAQEILYGNQTVVEMPWYKKIKKELW